MKRYIYVPPGTIMCVFDSHLWGGKDVGNNSQFWKNAEILKTYKNEDGKNLAEVRFQHDGRISTGHFIDRMREARP